MEQLLLAAASEGNVELAIRLLENGAKVDFANVTGSTALLVCCYYHWLQASLT
jgi:hypothetical protein